MLTILNVLGLLVAAAAPVSADKPGNSFGQGKGKAEAPSRQQNRADDGPDWAPPGREKMADEPHPGGRGQAKVALCHKPGTSVEKIPVVATSVVSAHLAHGDTPGPGSEIGEPEPRAMVPSAAVRWSRDTCFAVGPRRGA